MYYAMPVLAVFNVFFFDCFFIFDFFWGFENMGDMGWAGNALFGTWGGVTWAQLRYAGDGDSQFAWGGHEKAEKRDRV